MKRRISLLLAVVMILGSFSFVFAANDEVDPGKFLEQNGVLKGDTTGDLMLDKPLERRDSVILLSRLLGVEKEAKAFEEEGLPTWEDNNDGNYKGYLAWAQSNKYFQGHSEAKFGPRENITVKEYAVVLLRALGYYDEAADWKAVFETAKKLGVLEEVKKEADEEVLRGEMAQMTFNALGLKVKGEDKTLAEKLDIEMPAEKELKAEVAKETENLKEVVLELSNAKLADTYKLENANNYKVAGNVVERAELKGNDVIILLKDALKEGREYKLRVRSIDKAINKEYTFVARDNTIPAVEKVEALGEFGIKVITTEPVNVKDGNRGRNFLVDGKNIAMNVEVYGREIILTPYYNESFSEKVETLTIAGLEDFAGFKSASEEFPIEIVKDEIAPKVVDVISRGDKKVEVVFDKDIYKKSVKSRYDRNNLGNISYESGRHTIYADKAEKIDTNRAVYTFNEDLLRKRTEFTIKDVANHSGVAMEKVAMEARELLDDVEPELIDDKMTESDAAKGTATIKLYFDKDVSGTFVKGTNSDRKFETKDHFTLYEREVYKRNEVKDAFESAEYDVDKNGDLIKDVIVVKLKNLVEWTKTNEEDYVLEIEGFADSASGRNKMYRDYVEFRIEDSNAFAITDIKVSEARNDREDTEITIVFNSYVDRIIAEDPTNYIFTNTNGVRKDVKELKGEIVTEKNGTEVTLIIPDFKVADYKELRILDVLKDIYGDRLNSVYTYDFDLETISTGDYTLKEVAGKYELTPSFGAKNITLQTSGTETFVIKGNLDELTIDAPKAHVEIATGVTVKKVVVKAIGASSLDIEGTVEELALSTKNAVRVLGNVSNMKITSTVAEATVNVVKADGTVVEIKVPEDKVVELDATGTVIPETYTVALAGNAVKGTDYTVEGLEAATEGYKPVKRGATIKITAKNDIVVNEEKIPAGLAKEIIVNENKTITIDKFVEAPKTYAVTFEETNKVELKAEEIVVKDSKGEVVSELTKLGNGTYTYTVTKEAYEVVTGTFVIEDKDEKVTVTLKLVEKPVTYTVTFDSNGGTEVKAITDVEKDATVQLPQAPTKEGFEFKGWFTDKDEFTNEFTAETKITEDITVYAKWELAE